MLGAWTVKIYLACHGTWNKHYNLNCGEANKNKLADLIPQQQEEERDGPKFVPKILIDQVCGPVCINYTDQQIEDLAKFCTRDVLSADVIYNLGT